MATAKVAWPVTIVQYENGIPPVEIAARRALPVVPGDAEPVEGQPRWGELERGRLGGEGIQEHDRDREVQEEQHRPGGDPQPEVLALDHRASNAPARRARYR